MHSLTAIIQNKMGIHVRPSTTITEIMQEYTSVGKIILEAKGEQVHYQNVMNLLMLCLQEKDEVIIHVNGPDEAHWSSKMKKLLETEFDFPPQKS